jgi:hypothetical protein
MGKGSNILPVELCQMGGRTWELARLCIGTSTKPEEHARTGA